MGNGCAVDQKVVDALNSLPASGLEYFYSKFRMTSNATPAFLAAEMEMFHGKQGDADQGFPTLTYAQTNMTLQGKLPKRALLRELGLRVYADLIPTDRNALAVLLMNSYTGVKRGGDQYTYLGMVEDWLGGPSLARAMSVLQQAAPAATPLNFGSNWSTASCGARPIAQPIMLERDNIFSVFVTLNAPIPALAASEVIELYARIGVQWLE